MEGREGVEVEVEAETEKEKGEEGPEAMTREEDLGVDLILREVDPETEQSQGDIDPGVEIEPLVTETEKEGLPETKTDDRRTRTEREIETDLLKGPRETKIPKDRKESPDPGQDLRRKIKTVNNLRTKTKTTFIINDKNLMLSMELMSNKMKMLMEENTFLTQSSSFPNFPCILLE